MKLYSYWRSSAAYRVRTVLALKGLDILQVPVHLIADGGAQHQASYQQINPASLVPTLKLEHCSLNQSLAIIQYLDERYPEPALLPSCALTKAQVHAFALDIACDIHPLNNLRVLQYLTKTLGLSEAQKLAWIHHWLAAGFQALEVRLKQTAGRFCFADELTLADICLVPQVYNALRFSLPMDEYPRVMQVYTACMELSCFQVAAPEQQLDAPLS